MTIEVGIVRIGVALAVVGAVAVLGGCTSASEPVVSPSVSVSAVVTLSPSPTLSHEEQMLALIPEEAKGDDLFAAEAMAKFFRGLVPGLYRAEHASVWAFLSLPSCEFCASGMEISRAYVESGRTFDGGEFVIPELVLGSMLDIETGLAYVPIAVTETASVTYGPDGTELSRQDARRADFTLELALVGGLWRVNGVSYDVPCRVPRDLPGGRGVSIRAGPLTVHDLRAHDVACDASSCSARELDARHLGA